MINLMGKQAIEIAKIKDTHYKLKDKWCEEQENDLHRFFQHVEELVESSANSHQSAMAYQQAQQAKADFVNEVLTCWTKYRLVEDDPVHRDYRKDLFKQISDSQATK